ncbi:reverse transcriptase domain-containing protein [Tanacetum coccineum]
MVSPIVFSTPYHSQRVRLVGSHDRGLKRILERTVGENRASWSDKLDDALWAFRTAYKTPIGCTPYKRGVHRKSSSLRISELRDQVTRTVNLKEKTKKPTRFHDKNESSNVGDKVLLFQFSIKDFSEKLTVPLSGPFHNHRSLSYGTAKLSHADGSNFKVNCHRLKHYYGGDTPPLVIPDLQTFPKDN